jgi:hypothetical protein
VSFAGALIFPGLQGAPEGIRTPNLLIRARSAGTPVPLVETELVALDVLHHEARFVVAIGSQ